MTDTNIFSTQSEVAVFSILLKNPELYPTAHGLRFFMFSSTPHQILFKEIEDQTEKGFTADVNLIIGSLDGAGKLSEVGGKDYINYLLSLDFNPENFSEYIRFVTSAYKGRALLSTISSIRPDVLTTENIDDTIRSLNTTLESLMESSGGHSTSHVGDGVKSVLEDIVSRTKAPGIRGYSWGINDIDLATGGKSPGELWIIGGRPSQGKTALICNSILSDGKNGIPCLVFEKEMNYSTLVERLVAIETGIPITNIRLGILNQQQIEQIVDGLAKIKKYPIYIDTSFTGDLHYTKSTIQRYKTTHDIKVVYVDYLQLMSQREENQTHELGRISRMFKLVSNDSGICTVALSQLNRGVEMREDRRPMMADLRQSGNLEEDADFVVGLYRDEYYYKETKHKGMMEFIILKSRNGPVGTVTLKFNPESNKITHVREA